MAILTPKRISRHRVGGKTVSQLNKQVTKQTKGIYTTVTLKNVTFDITKIYEANTGTSSGWTVGHWLSPVGAPNPGMGWQASALGSLVQNDTEPSVGSFSASSSAKLGAACVARAPKPHSWFVKRVSGVMTWSGNASGGGNGIGARITGSLYLGTTAHTEINADGTFGVDPWGVNLKDTITVSGSGREADQQGYGPVKLHVGESDAFTRPVSASGGFAVEPGQGLVLYWHTSGVAAGQRYTDDATTTFDLTIEYVES
jgi:hypothetical protein